MIMIKIYYAKSSEWEKKISLSALLDRLPKDLKERALRYHFSTDAYNFVLGRLMLKKALGELSLPTEFLKEMYYNESGKPLINGLSFSISHSKDLVACAFNKEGNIGLDVEFPREIERGHFRHCFSDAEWRLIQEDESMHTFYQFWTQKEAILKANGAGLADLLNIRIENNQTAYFYNKETSTNTRWKLKAIQFGDSLAYACLCTDLKAEVSLESFDIMDDLK